MADSHEVFRNFGFLLELQGERAAFFTRVEGLGVDWETIEYREGGDQATVRKFTGRKHVPDVTVSKGVTRSRAMWDWMSSADSGDVQRRNISIILLHTDASTEVARWNLVNAFVSGWRLLDLDAQGDDMAIECLTISAEDIRRAEV